MHRTLAWAVNQLVRRISGPGNRGWLLVFLAAVPGVAAQQGQPGRALTLSEALEIAKKESENLGIARAGIESARGEQRRARSEFFPQLSGAASYTRTLETQFAALAEDEEDEPPGTPPPPTSCPTFVPDPAASPEERLARWTEANSAAVHRSKQTLSEIWESDNFDLATLSVALRAIRTLVSATSLPYKEA